MSEYWVSASDMHLFKTTPLARNADVHTSHDAAEKACEFIGRHEDMILACLKSNGPRIPAEIARITGLDYHATQRRMGALHKKLLIERTGVVRFGQHELRAL